MDLFVLQIALANPEQGFLEPRIDSTLSISLDLAEIFLDLAASPLPIPEEHAFKLGNRMPLNLQKLSHLSLQYNLARSNRIAINRLQSKCTVDIPFSHSLVAELRFDNLARVDEQLENEDAEGWTLADFA